MHTERLLNTDWKTRKKSDVPDGGTTITTPGYDTSGWMNALVPGTVLSTLVHNGHPDPYSPPATLDISVKDVDYYTYWFYNSFKLPSWASGEHVWLHFRGINHAADVFFNGKKLNAKQLKGMFLRRAFDVTASAISGGDNRLAVLVYPPDPPGKPDPTLNGGDPSHKNIGENVTMRYPVGWDWIAPVADRNTGIWDQVSSGFTGPVRLMNPHVVTKADPNGKLKDKALLTVHADLVNLTTRPVTATLKCTVQGASDTPSTEVVLQPHQPHQPHQPRTVGFATPLVVDQPRLWWPNGLGGSGPRELYTLMLSVEVDGKESDNDQVRFGIREFNLDKTTGGKLIKVNGQKVFIRGGNWMGTDAMLRQTHLSAKRYRDEIRMHAEMNLNMIRVWGAGIAERPEFYDACDEYGILVMQDFWLSGEFTGPFPLDHTDVFQACARDTIRLLRNHASLCFWSGGNETVPAPELDSSLRSYIEGEGDDVLDGTRTYVSGSLSDGLGPGDGPYGIQRQETFFEYDFCAFNPECGSVGTPVAESIRRMMPQSADDFPKDTPWTTSDPIKDRPWNDTWDYHTYIPYSNPDASSQPIPCADAKSRPLRPTPDQIAPYGKPKSLDDFCMRAQLVNYVQYQAFCEGFGARMWDWYTGVLIWKTQNPWTGLRGQLYDWYLDQTGGFYGARHACEAVHVQVNLDDQTVCVVNTSVEALTNATATVSVYDLTGKSLGEQKLPVDAPAGKVSKRQTMQLPASLPSVYFLRLQLRDDQQVVRSQNFYWRSTSSTGDFKPLRKLGEVALESSCQLVQEGANYVLTATLTNPTTSGAVAFFIRLKLLKHGASPDTDNRVLPTFYSDNYFSLLPDETRIVTIDCAQEDAGGAEPELWVEGYNVKLVQV